MMNNIFKNLFVLDLANNHFGDMKHAKKIIKKFSLIAKKNKIKAAIKFQFRDYDNYIHKDYINTDNNYVRRFLDTKLSILKFKELFNYTKKNNLLTACTPFDENSIKIIENFNFDILKIASVSSNDFTLLKRAVKNKIPKIISTGGLNILQIDKIVRIMTKYNQSFSLMHCIAIYPSKDSDLQISFIKSLRKRYPGITIGWSTHEDPRSFMPSSLAKACGAEMFERHVGIRSKKYNLNSYSMEPEIFQNYLDNLKKTEQILGQKKNKKKIITKKEIVTLQSLQRGLYAKYNLQKGEVINDKNSYLAFPLQKNQIPANNFNKGMILKSNIQKDKPILNRSTKNNPDITRELKIWEYIHNARGILNENKIAVGNNFEMEISHHKSLENFPKTGCYLFNLINKEYAKKIILLLPNQNHPVHRHKIKNETFHILSGSLTLTLDGKIKKLKKGDIIDIKKNVYHKFKAGPEGCIFDEISTTSIKSDSFYKNLKIKKLKRSERKTIVTSWF